MMTSSSPPRIPPERSHRETLRSLQSQLGKVSFVSRSEFASRCPVQESWLPGGGLQEGSLLELFSGSTGAGVWELAFQLVKQLQQERFTPILIDNQQEFFPPGAAELGIDLNRLIVVQPRSLSDQLWAIEQALRCEGKTVVLSSLGRVSSTTYRRLKLAAERGKSLGLFLREASLRSFPSWADHRLLVNLVRSSSKSRRYRVTALNSSEGTTSHSVLECCDDSGALSLVP
ncbi:ImuA family protein [Planctomicrobium sp. SH527]|uniref:ImuA family protein n=1 Tax=Planctomicrobium sp. SH527 TaxID=3448123 RepID=UPI003F5C04A0